MAELSINTDLMGELWPIIPAPAPASDDDVEIDVTFASLLQGQPLEQPATAWTLQVQGPGGQGPEVQGPRVQGPRVQGSEVQGPGGPGPRGQGPQVQGPRVQGPEVRGPEVQGPRGQGPRVLEDAGIPIAVPGLPARAVPQPVSHAIVTHEDGPSATTDVIEREPHTSIVPAAATTVAAAKTVHTDVEPRPQQSALTPAPTVERPRVHVDPVSPLVDDQPTAQVSAKDSDHAAKRDVPLFDAPPAMASRPAMTTPVASVALPVASAPSAPMVHEAPTPTALPPQLVVPTTEDGAPVMPKLVEMMRWQAREGGGTAELRLRPELLGAVTVSIVVENGAVKATVSAETPAALEYLRSEASGLQEALEERGLTLDEFEVCEQSPYADRDREQHERPRERQEFAPAPRRRVAPDTDAVFNVLV